MKIDSKKAEEVADFFDKEIMPIINPNKKGLEHFRQLVRTRREEVENKKEKRKSITSKGS